MLRQLTYAALLVSGLAWAADPAEAEVVRLLQKADDVGRGASSVATMSMHVKTATYERSMKMKTWAKGTEKTLVKILEPAKDAGVATLKVDENLWNYLPKVDRTMKVPAGMMSGSWMGSHFTNDDLVKDSRMSEDFTFKVDARPSAGKGSWVITLVPKPDAPVVWGKVVATIRADEQPESMRYYDEKGVLVRTMVFSDYVTLDGRKMPRSMKLVPADKPGEYTEVRYEEIDFDPVIPESTFTLQALK